MYLELGLGRGASLIAALAGNEDTILKAYAIDNFAGEDNFRGVAKQPYNPEAERTFDAYVAEHLNGCQDRLTKICADLHTVSPDLIKQPITVFYYDADHKQTGRGVLRFMPRMASPSVILIDDWCLDMVRADWRRAIQTSDMTIVEEWELPIRKVGDLDLWWYGFYVAVLRRKKAV